MIRLEFEGERERCNTLEKDLFKVTTQCRKLEQQIKKLQELNTVNAKNNNNTSSQFSLPSEFKEKWNELVTEQILDAFPDFLDKFHILIPLVHELFVVVRQAIEKKWNLNIENIAKTLNLGQGQHEELKNKLQSVFQEHSKTIFKFSDDDLNNLIDTVYKPRVQEVIDEHSDDFEDNVSADEFKTFLKTMVDLNLHMVLNDPPIMLSV